MHSSQNSDKVHERLDNDSQERPVFRPSKPIPYELREHCVIYFEEELYIQALTLLFNLLVAGTSSPTPLPAFTPPPQHLSLAATLLVHPSLTTRAKSTERLQASNLALRLLRHTLKLVGPLNADFNTAFAFTYFNTSRRGGSNGRRSRVGGDDNTSPNGSGGGDDPEVINSEIANAGSVWARAEDFWQVVGWAFNCSVVYPQRWVRWRIWLEFMMDVLEEDWVLREEEDMGVAEGTEEDSLTTTHARQGSLIAKYLQLEGGKIGGNRRVIRAIFADGGTKAINEFTEIFKNETKALKKDDDGSVLKKPKEKVNVEEDIFADYLEDDDDNDDDDDNNNELNPPNAPRTPLKPKNQPKTTTTTTTTTCSPLGTTPSLVLRLRLLSLLSTISYTLPDTFLPLSDLYTLYASHIRPLPLHTFTLLTVSLPTLPPTSRSSLSQFLLRSLLTSSAPVPSSDDLDQEALERYWLPWAANTASVGDNARVGVLVEGLFRLVEGEVGLVWSAGLEGAVERGIVAREERARGVGDGRRRKRKGSPVKGGRDEEGEAEEGEEWEWLRGSAERMRALLGVIRPGGESRLSK